MPNPILILTALLINIICVWSVLLMRREEHGTSRKYYFLLLSGIPAGAVFALLFRPLTLPDILLSALTGGAIGELLTVFFLTVRQTCPREAPLSCYDDGSPGRFFITGDKHRRFDRVKEFCREVNTRPKDVLIILGDTGFNYYDDKRDDELKKEISQLPVTLFCLHGNKENRPQNVGTYGAFAAERFITSRNTRIFSLQSTVVSTPLRAGNTWWSAGHTAWTNCAVWKRGPRSGRMKCPTTPPRKRWKRG